MSDLSFYVGDPDAEVIFPVTDTTGGDTDWPDPKVLVGETEVSAEWLGDPAPTRDLRIPLTGLMVGVYDLWLKVPGDDDIKLGTVAIVASSVIELPDYGGCTWPLDPACLSDEWDDLPPATKERAAALASSTLERLTGGRVTNCPVTVRPCLQRGGCAFPPQFGVPYADGFYPGVNVHGQWVNTCGCQGRHTCGTDCEVRLPPPVGRVIEVRVDGAVIPSTDYMLQGHMLVYAGSGDCPWPTDQDLSKPDTEAGTFSVTYLNGYPVDAMGAYAAGTLAMEFAKACTGGKCRLPAGVTTIVRQGVTMEIASGAFPNGLTGIRTVDAFIAMWNPNGLKARPMVWSPDLPQYRTVR